MGLMERDYQKYSILKRLEQIKRGPKLAFRAAADELEIQSLRRKLELLRKPGEDDQELNSRFKTQNKFDI